MNLGLYGFGNLEGRIGLNAEALLLFSKVDVCLRSELESGDGAEGAVLF